VDDEINAALATDGTIDMVEVFFEGGAA